MRCRPMGIPMALEKKCKNPLTNRQERVIILTESEVNTMRDTYTVYDNRTGDSIFCGFLEDVEDYLECEGRYTVVKDEK